MKTVHLDTYLKNKQVSNHYLLGLFCFLNKNMACLKPSVTICYIIAVVFTIIVIFSIERQWQNSEEESWKDPVCT